MRCLFAATTMLALVSTPAFAHHQVHSDRHHHHTHGQHGSRHYAAHGRAWCGAYMRHVFGIADARLNLAGNWASVGANAGGPRVGAVVVWPHHVGVIRGGPDSNGQWLVESGNDGNAVRTRYRSLRGAIAFRYVGGSLGLGERRYARRANVRPFGSPDNESSETAARGMAYTRVAENRMRNSQRGHPW